MSSAGLQQLRPPALHPSALSPLEWDTYFPLLACGLTSFGGTEVEAAKVAAVWSWLKGWLGEVDKHVEEAILAFFRVPVAPSSPPSHLLLALLRLYSHSKTSKHLTRDLIFIQTDPAPLKDVSELASTPWTNPFRRANSPAMIRTTMSPLGSPVIVSPTDTLGSTKTTTSTAPSSRGPAPPLPAKRHPISPPSSSSPDPIPPRPSTNPFRGRAFSSNALLPSQQAEVPGPYALPASPPPSTTSASPSQPASTSNWNAIASPPLPPRPATKEKHSSPSRVSSRPPSIKSDHVPRPPVRRSSSASTTTPPVLSIIGSSAPSHRSTSTFAIPEIAPKPRNAASKLVASSHIGPTTRLRNTPSPIPPLPAASWEASAPRSRPMERSDSFLSGTSTYVAGSPPKKPWPTPPVPDDDARTTYTAPLHSRPPPPVPLGRSRTLGSKPIPPPPKRRPESLALLDPFGDAQRPTHQRTVSLSSRRSLPATSGGSGRKDLGGLVGDVGALLQQGGMQSEEWINKAREGIKGRRMGERERLVGGEEEGEEEGEEDREVVERRRECEREGSASEEGWSRL